MWNTIKRIWGIGIMCALLLSPTEAKGQESDWDRLIPAIISVESSGDPHAVSKKGCIGLMQISEIVIKEFNKNYKGKYVPGSNGFYPMPLEEIDLHRGSVNIEIGTWYLRRLKDHYLKESNVQIFDAPFRFNVIRINTWDKVPTYSFKHTKYIKCANDYKLALILAAYNGGITRLRKVKYDINKMPSETRTYIRRVINLYNLAK